MSIILAFVPGLNELVVKFLDRILTVSYEISVFDKSASNLLRHNSRVSNQTISTLNFVVLKAVSGCHNCLHWFGCWGFDMNFLCSKLAVFGR